MIHIDDLCLNVGAFSLRNVSLHIDSGQYFVVLGPTGSGKSLLLKCICGLVRPDAGRIRINGKDVTHLEPRLRNVGYVPQDYGLFRHITVEENITFALRAHDAAGSWLQLAIEIGGWFVPGPMRRWVRQTLAEARSAQYRARVAPLVDMLRIGHLLERYPVHLSGGERQRVALARALAIKPSLLLLDEPVSALDEATRDRVCTELRRLQEELGVTTIHVSHNMEEAMAVSERAGVIQEGRLVQTGTMSELLRQPETEDLARFLRAENIFTGNACTLAGAQPAIEFAGTRIPVLTRLEGKVRFMVRPEHVRVTRPEDAPDSAFSARLDTVGDRGAYRRLVLEGPKRIVAYVPVGGVDLDLVPGGEYGVEMPPEAVHVLG